MSREEELKKISDLMVKQFPIFFDIFIKLLNTNKEVFMAFSSLLNTDFPIKNLLRLEEELREGRKYLTKMMFVSLDTFEYEDFEVLEMLLTRSSQQIGRSHFVFWNDVVRESIEENINIVEGFMRFKKGESIEEQR